MVPKESGPASSNVDTLKKEVYVNELDTLVDHEARDLIVGPNFPLYDGTKSIKHVDLSPFSKIINLIIENNIDSRQHKIEVGIDRAKFII